MDDPGQAADERLIWTSASVPAVVIGEAGMAIVDAWKLARDLVEIGACEAIGVAGKIERPAAESCTRFLRIGAAPVWMGEEGRFLELHDVGDELAVDIQSNNSMKDVAV